MAQKGLHPWLRRSVWAGAPPLAVLALLGLKDQAVSGVAAGGGIAFPFNAPDPDPVVTFAKDVAPILQQSCQLCHQPGGIGPMSLLTYEDARRYAPLIKHKVVTREMPPYHYDTDVGIQQLKNDWRLSPEAIQTIAAWVDAGMPMGNPADLPAPVAWPDPGEFRLAARFGPPDIVIKSAPYTVPASGQDRWWRPAVPSGIEVDRCIMAIETKPSVAGRAVTHHANTRFRPAAVVDADDDDNAAAGSRLSEYALGKIGEIIPPDACRIAPANSMVSWDIHYYPNGTEVQDDQVEVGIWLHPAEITPENRFPQTLASYSLQSGTGDFEIPPHGTLMTQGYRRFDTPVRIDSWQPHGHLRLVAKRLEVLYPDGRRETISMVSNWHPGWHHSHVYESDVAPLLPAGAFIINTAWYDNTENNPHNPDPDQWVGTGDRTADEMSHAWIAVTHLDEEGYQRLLAERGETDRAAGAARGRGGLRGRGARSGGPPTTN